jgi:hypothetical protein
MPRRMKLAEIEATRHQPNRSALLFITDRCPVGCDHCSVDSRKDSPMIEDWELFRSVVEALATKPGLDLIGISGGEPFVERRGLTQAVDRFSEAGRDVVLYTSGVWAGSNVPSWIPSVFSKASAAFLSTDAFHAAAVSKDQWRYAAEVILGQGCPLIIQVLDEPASIELGSRLQQQLLALDAAASVELNTVPPLPYGRGVHTLAGSLRSKTASDYGRCGALTAPVVRYDGKVIACCNEQLIMGIGPASLRKSCTTSEQVQTAMQGYTDDPALKLVRLAGVGGLLLHPRLAPLGTQKCRSLCEACWMVQDKISDRSDRLLKKMVEIVA